MDDIDKIFTGERFIPGIKDKKLEAEHYQRYRSICDFVINKKVLDAACGEGYGSFLLAEYANSVVGVDILERTIVSARQKYHSRKNLSFEIGNINELPIDDKSIDVVISYETIEHVNGDMQIQFLQEINRILKPQGILIMSTPNKSIYSDLYNFHNEYHIKEFYREEFMAFLKLQFRNVKLYNQFLEVTSVIDSCDGKLNQIKYYKDCGEYYQDGKYYIAVATNGEIPKINISSVYVNSTQEHEENIQRILKLQDEEENRNRHIEKLNNELLENGGLVKELQKEVAERNNHIQDLDIELHNNRDKLLEMQEELQQKELAIQEKEICYEKYRVELKNQQESDRNQLQCLQKEKYFLSYQIDEKNLEMQAKENAFWEIQTKLQDAQNLIVNLEKKGGELQQIVCNKEGHIELLLEVERAFERVKVTHSYKIARYIKTVSDAILPLDSKRRFFIRILYNLLKNPRLMLHVVSPTRIKNYRKYVRKEGMKGVKSRYQIAVEKERSYRYPSRNLKLQLEKKINKINKSNIQSYSNIEFKKYENPLISIIIPVYNEFEYTYNCLKSILKNAGCLAYEIIIADDSSTDATVYIQEKIKNISVITTEQNVGFLINCNNAAKYAKGKYILFLNNDTQVQDNWLSPLLQLVENDEKIGMVGSKLLYPNGQLQEAGGIIWKDGSAWNYGHLCNPSDPEYNYIKEVDYISGASIMIRSFLWKKIGGFDERYVPAYCEDSDLAFEVRELGYKIVYQPLSVVVHFEGISNGKEEAEGQKSYQVVNQNKFYIKWKRILERDNCINGENVFVARDRSMSKKHILVVDHYIPHYDQDAGGKTSFMYLELFVKLGLKVTFIGDNFYKHEPYATLLNQRGIEILYGAFYHDNWAEWLKKNAHYFHFIYLQRPHISEKYIDLLKLYSNAKIFYYAHDLHHLRELRQYMIDKDESTLMASEYWKKIEYELFEKADVGHVVGGFEQNIIQKIYPNKPIRNIPAYIYEEIPKEVPKNFSERKNLIFVGGFGHPPNEGAVLWFAKKVFPLILENIPELRWHIVGSKVTKQIQNLSSENIVVEGYLSDAELKILYYSSRLAVCPLLVGAGVKGKVIEAAYYQLPLITTSIGAEGLDSEVGNMIVEDDAVKMASLISNIYGNYKKLSSMSDAGELFIKKYFMVSEAERILKLDMEINNND